MVQQVLTPVWPVGQAAAVHKLALPAHQLPLMALGPLEIQVCPTHRGAVAEEPRRLVLV